MEYTQSVYILLTRTGSILSRTIAFLTRAPYTHAALSLDDEFEELYSFTRLNPRYILPAGFAKENLGRGLYLARKDPPCRVYRMRVTEGEYAEICERVRDMFRNRARYHYNYLGVAANYFGRQYTTPHRFFCSEFVATMVALGNPNAVICPARTRPIDFTTMTGLECVFEGTVGGLRDYIALHRAIRMGAWGRQESLPAADADLFEEDGTWKEDTDPPERKEEII